MQTCAMGYNRDKTLGPVVYVFAHGQKSRSRCAVDTKQMRGDVVDMQQSCDRHGANAERLDVAVPRFFIHLVSHTRMSVQLTPGSKRFLKAAAGRKQSCS
jgi:hypothetical protein